MKQLFRSIFAILTALFVGLGIFTAETVADEVGWTATVRTFVKDGWSAVVDAGYSDWLWAGALFFGGITAALWVDYFVRKFFPYKFKKLAEVNGEKFRHQEVVIDGKKFIDCVFDGVTLVYYGTGFFGFESNEFSGHFSIRVSNQSAEGGLGLAKLGKQLGIPILFEDDQLQSHQDTLSGTQPKSPHD